MTRLRQSWPSVTRAENVAIWRAARRGNEEKLLALLEESLDDVGRDPDSWVHARRLNWLHDRKGTTPLMAAASNRRGAAAVSVLLAARCVDVNAVDNTQQLNTALHYAAINNTDSAATENLLLAGADALRLNRKGHTPLDEARIHGRRNVARALLEHMTVHADWLYVRGRFRWRKYWGVLLACDAARSATELCIYQSPTHVRPDAVVLLDEHTSVFPFASTDSYCWLQHPFAFTTNRPVMWQSVRRQQFTRAPECKKTITHERAETSHVVFAADDKANLDMWIRVLTPPPSQVDMARQGRQSGVAESFYWPRESLAAGVVQVQSMEVGRRATTDAVVFEPPIPVRNRSATAPAPSPPQITSSPTSPRSDGDPAIANRTTLARRSRATSSPARQSTPSLSIVTQATASPEMSVIHSEGARHDGSDDNSLVATTTDADEHDPLTAELTGRSEEQQNEGAQPESTPQSQGDQPEQDTDQPEAQRIATPRADDTHQTPRQRDPCMICVSAPRDAACAPCGHLAACHACLLTAVQTYRVCPICRARVRSVMRIYDA